MDLSRYLITADEDGNTYVSRNGDPTFSTRKRVHSVADIMNFVVAREAQGVKK